ncbi:hypothetical protein [Conyzicola sp.]|uniref:hypothetical protein n=1 Tax=Conyzicola sp. TaxID=1969404 RepID=UPI0039898036
MFLRSGKSTDGWALIGFGVFACIFSAIGLSGGFGLAPGGRAGTLIFLGIPLGIAAIIAGVLSLNRDGRRPEN